MSLELQNIILKLGDNELLQINETVGGGEILTIMGASGSGKSSLLALIAGFLEPIFSYQGNVLLNGKNITKAHASIRRVGILFQDPLLFPHLSVGENLLFALDNSRAKTMQQRKKLTNEFLAKVELPNFFARDPATLSGGQQARIALARVLISNPQALLLDEPFSKLDMELREQMRKLVFSQAKNQNLPVVLVSHDEADAKAAGGKIIRLAS